MSVMMIRYQVAEAGVPELLGAIEATFEALAAKRPAGVRFAYGRRAGSTEFFALLELDEGVENPLLGLAEAGALQATVAKLAVGDPPKPQPVERLGAYGFPG